MLNFRMSKKLAKCNVSIWAFLTGLVEHFVDPTRFEMMQLNNGLNPRKKKSRYAETVNRVITTAERKLSTGVITPIEFVMQMSHQFKGITFTDEERAQIEQDHQEGLAAQAEIGILHF